DFTYDVHLDAQGHGQVQVTLTHGPAEGGLNLITSAVVGSDGVLGPASEPITLAFGRSAPPPPPPPPPPPATPYFNQTTIQGVPNDNYTSLQFGPDGRLYVARVDGTILALKVQATASGFAVAAGGTEVIDSIRKITNYNDDGALASAGYQGTRQVTGILATSVSPGGPVELYVSSSDPRIGAGPSGGDSNLDTNSGVVSRLTETADGSWSRVDLVRGLPRSEENHSVNGMQLSQDGHTLYLGVGGNTNAGAPSNNFAYTPEYAYSAAILSIDLTKIDAMATTVDRFGNPYKYNIPTLSAGPSDPYPDDPFGGRDGYGQAKIVVGGPVQVYSPGFRNPYDLVITQSGHMFAVDNGANAGWGGPPTNQGPNVTNAPSEGGQDYPDQLFLVTPGFYAGHPDPIRANPQGAGLYPNGSTTPATDLPRDWPPVPTANPIEGVFHSQADSGSLYAGFSASTDGITEYTASTFGGAMKGDLLIVSWDDQLYRVHLTADGTHVASITKLTSTGVLGNGLPLDVTAQGDGRPFAGDIFAANYGGGITVLTPTDTPPPPPPPLGSGDADGDGIIDANDAFALDPNNGTSTALAAGATLSWKFSQNINPPGPKGLFNMGFTGLMTNGKDPYTALYDPSNIKPGGAAAGFQIEQVPAGDAFSGNSQQNGFQFGVNVQPEVSHFVIETKLDNPFGGNPSTSAVNYKSQGFFIGTGDQSNYLKIVASANSGHGGIEVGVENAGAFTTTMYGANLADPTLTSLDNITLRLSLDVAAGTATPSWTYTVNGAPFSGFGATVQLSGATLSALHGGYSIGGHPSELAVGLISTSFGSGQPFTAYWQSIDITADPTAPPAAHQLLVTETGGSTAVTEGGPTDTVNLALSSQPTADVTVTVAGDADVNGSPTTLTFTAANWNIAQAVTVSAVDDTAAEGSETPPDTAVVTQTAHLSFTTNSTDAGYNRLSVPALAVSATDNDCASPPPPPPPTSPPPTSPPPTSPPPVSPPPPSSGGQTLQAQAGGSNLQGGTGDDTLIAGRGPDTMTGGAGADHFV
ncbi:MAG: Kelch repeat-containing protein, partial [Phenylobacterium sp.]|nr:Kelch repeat-containing protein [Phenylobacterium sp.]